MFDIYDTSIELTDLNRHVHILGDNVLNRYGHLLDHLVCVRRRFVLRR